MTTPERDPERVETVARAIHDDDCDCEKWPCAWTADRRYRRLAAAAIAALPPSPAEEAVKRVEALIEAHETTARRRRKLAQTWHDAGRWQLADAFRNLARQAETTAFRYRAALASPAPAPQGQEQR